MPRSPDARSLQHGNDLAPERRIHLLHQHQCTTVGPQLIPLVRVIVSCCIHHWHRIQSTTERCIRRLRRAYAERVETCDVVGEEEEKEGGTKEEKNETTLRDDQTWTSSEQGDALQKSFAQSQLRSGERWGRGRYDLWLHRGFKLMLKLAVDWNKCRRRIKYSL